MATSPVKSPWAAPRHTAETGALLRPFRNAPQRIAERARTRAVAVHSGLRTWIAEEENQLLVCCAAFISLMVLALWASGRNSK